MSVAQRGSDAGERHHSSRRWLREASLQRLNMFMRNKTEMIGNAAQLGMGVISMEGLEQSGLSASEIFHLRQWIAGLITGRQCMFALLDCRNSGKEESGAVESAVSYQNLKPSEYVRSAMDLPDNFLCDSGYLYNTIFSRPQTAVVREALVMLSKKAFEKSPATLDIEQINIAIKQLKLDNLGGKGASDDEKLDGESQQPSEEGEKNNQTTNEQNFRLQILVELIRSHIIHHCRDGEKLFAREMEDDGTSESDSVKYPLYTEYKQKKNSALGAKTEMDRDNRSELRDLDDPRMNIDMSVLEEHLSASVESIAEEAKNTPSEVLESVNSVLKPYLKQLSTLKAQLTIQLKELRDSRAYLCLGVTADASDATIKKAYHMLAIKLHPDKPGGDTAKFQQLQDYYQDIMKTRKAAKTERDAVNKMRGRASTHQEPFEESDLSSAFNCENKTETSEEPQEQAEKVESQDDLVEKEVESSETTKDEAEVVEPEHSSKAVEGTIKIKPSISPKASVENLEENVNSSVGQDDRKKTTKLEEGEFQFDKEDGPSLADDRKEEYESDSAHAAAIASKIDLLLGKIKEAATDCTNLAQLNIKWQKKIEKATSYQFPQGLRELKKLINCKTSNKSFDEKASDASFTFNAESCSLQKAVSPIEACCELSQKVSSLAMELSSQCGVRFAMTASTNKTFLQAVEKSMMFSLGALKTVVTLIHAHEQLMSCLRSVQDSMPVAAENEEVYDLVCEMVRAGVKSNVVTISNAVDRVVETALTTSTVCDCIHAIIRQTEAQILADAKKKAELEAQEEQEQDYCEEDREALRKCREERQQEFFRQSAQEKNESNGSQKKTDQNNMEDFFGEGIKSLDDLRDKIKTLQLQLKLQHVQALQTMNKETIQLQQQILQELKGLPFVTSVESLFSDNRSKPKADGESSGFKFSLLSLIAEFVDSSCNSIRAGFADMVAAKFEDESCLWMELGEYVDGRAKLTVQDIKLVENHLNWLAIVLSDSSNLMDGFYEKIWNHVNANRYPCDILSQEEEEFAYTANVRKSKLALLPDFRSKTLYLASMIDGESLQCIVKEELFDRMLEIVQEHTNKIFSKREDKMAKLLLEISSDSATKTNEDILDCDDDNRISSIYGSYPSFRTSVFRDSLSDDSQESVNQKLDYPRTFLHEDPDFISYLDSAYADMIYGSEDQQRHEDDAADNLRASSVHDYLDEESEDEDDLGLLYPKSYKNLYSKYFPDEDLVHANYESSVGFDGLKTSAEKSYLSRNYRRNENYNDINQHVNDDNHFF